MRRGQWLCRSCTLRFAHNRTNKTWTRRNYKKTLRGSRCSDSASQEHERSGVAARSRRRTLRLRPPQLRVPPALVVEEVEADSAARKRKRLSPILLLMSCKKVLTPRHK